MSDSTNHTTSYSCDSINAKAEQIARHIKTARRKIHWVSSRLEWGLFNQDSIYQAFKECLIQPHHFELHIYVKELQFAIQQHHPLLSLFQRLSSKVTIREIPAAVATNEFILLDERQVITQIGIHTLDLQISKLARPDQTIYLDNVKSIEQYSQTVNHWQRLSL